MNKFRLTHYWNYKTNPKEQDKSWGNSIYTDFKDFKCEALKICVEIPNSNLAQKLCEYFSELDSQRFSDGDWYKFTKSGITKGKAILAVCEACHVDVSEIVAFGDDYADIGMLKMCGVGVAMGNAIQEVKDIADDIKIFEITDYENARCIMSECRLTEDTIDNVIDIIKERWFKGTETTSPKSIEGKIVQDAERLCKSYCEEARWIYA